MLDNRLVLEWLFIIWVEVEVRGWDELDVVIIFGDVYVDYLVFGIVVIGCILESEGLCVVIVLQFNWQDDLCDFKKMGKFCLFFGVIFGCMDSMVNYYMVVCCCWFMDVYILGGVVGFWLDYVIMVYIKVFKQVYLDVLVFIGGIEAFLCCVMYYDYWFDKFFFNILEMSGVDMFVYGMGELLLREIVCLL